MSWVAVQPLVSLVRERHAATTKSHAYACCVRMLAGAIPSQRTDHLLRCRRVGLPTGRSPHRFTRITQRFTPSPPLPRLYQSWHGKPVTAHLPHSVQLQQRQSGPRCFESVRGSLFTQQRGWHRMTMPHQGWHRQYAVAGQMHRPVRPVLRPRGDVAQPACALKPRRRALKSTSLYTGRRQDAPTAPGLAPTACHGRRAPPCAAPATAHITKDSLTSDTQVQAGWGHS